MEILDIVDEHGEPTGKTVERETAHREGIRHRTAHVWLRRERDKKTQILLQKRSETKDSNPGCYDVSSAGHIPAGVDYIPSALRELEEELGLKASPGQLVPCGMRSMHKKGVFRGKVFDDNQVIRVFCLDLDVDPSELKLQESEVSEVCWMDLQEAKEGVINNSFPNCIAAEELEMLRNQPDMR